MSYVKELYSHLVSGKVAVVSAGDGSNALPRQELINEQQTQLLALKKAVMFKLPVDGLVLDDPEFRGVNETEDIHFPFGTMTLEFKNNDSVYSKVVILIDDVLVLTADAAQHDDDLAKKLLSKPIIESHRPLIITSWVYSPKRHSWGQHPAIILPTRDWGKRSGSELGINVAPLRDVVGGEAFFAEVSDPVMACVMGFLNAANCSNVEAHPIKPHRAGAKTPLPFDDYYVLSIGKIRGKGEPKGELGFDRHGPREHLRRGHIRRLTHLDGRRIWINAAVVNAGAPGVIHKAYKVESV